MRLVILESPYAGDIERNERYARACLHDCLMRGESPIASHLLYTQPGVLKDDDEVERRLGIAAGHAWMRVCDATVVYIDLGMSKGMIQGCERAELLEKPIEYRSLEGWNATYDKVFHNK